MPKKVLVGKVVSNKMDKTVVVAVESRSPHHKYEKQIAETRKFKAHDAENKSQMADVVRMQECRQFAKDEKFADDAVTGHAISNKASEVSAS